MTLTWYKNKLLSHLSYEEAKELVESLDKDIRHQLEYDEFRLSEESTLEKVDGTLSSAFDFKKSALLSDLSDDRCYPVYIDTESSFREDRIKSIAKSRGLDGTKTLKNIQVAKTHSSKEQESCIEAAYPFVKSNSNIKLLIVDSMTNHYRHEYAKLSNLPARQHTLNTYMYKLLRVAQTNKVAVVITNQVQINPKSKSLNKEQIIGGNILSHISTYLIHLWRLDSLTVRAELQKSPNKGFDWHCLTIEETGFMDLPKPKIISDQNKTSLAPK